MKSFDHIENMIYYNDMIENISLSGHASVDVVSSIIELNDEKFFNFLFSDQRRLITVKLIADMNFHYYQRKHITYLKQLINYLDKDSIVRLISKIFNSYFYDVKTKQKIRLKDVNDILLKLQLGENDIMNLVDMLFDANYFCSKFFIEKISKLKNKSLFIQYIEKKYEISKKY